MYEPICFWRAARILGLSLFAFVASTAKVTAQPPDAPQMPDAATFDELKFEKRSMADFLSAYDLYDKPVDWDTRRALGNKTLNWGVKAGWKPTSKVDLDSILQLFGNLKNCAECVVVLNPSGGGWPISPISPVYSSCEGLYNGCINAIPLTLPIVEAQHRRSDCAETAKQCRVKAGAEGGQ